MTSRLQPDRVGNAAPLSLGDGPSGRERLGGHVDHGGVSWASGGFLGVETFFVLSGFLITSLLVVEWRRASKILLRRFWERRARRLLPALFCLVAVVGVYQAVAGAESAIPGVKADGIATLFYFGNWHQIASESNYFAATGPPSPLQHTWSLAIEEQFYLFWPGLLLGVLWAARRAARRPPSERRALLVLLTVAVVGAAVSSLETAVLVHGGSDPNRIYYGTDTRAMSLLTGAALAVLVALLPPAVRSGASAWASRGQRALGASAVVALTGVIVMMALAVGTSSWLYPAGLLGLDLGVAVVIAAVVLTPSSPVARIFAWTPARAVGQISYGIYLWHFPLFLWISASATGIDGIRLLMLRLTVTLVVSVISFFLIEQPVRRRRLPDRFVASLAPVALGGALAALFLASAAAAPSSASAPLPASSAQFEGTAAACTVLLRDTPRYGLSPLSPGVAAVAQPAMEAAHRLSWHWSSRVTFHTCPPKRAMLIGDSLAFSIGLGVMYGEQHYGVELANAAILGCAFTNRGQLDISGKWSAQPPGCAGALGQWAAEERAFHPRVVVVELGYRDEFDWRWNGRLQHLGDRAFDRYLRQRIDDYVHVLGAGGVKLLFLSVPWTHPADLPNGSPAPAANPARHRLINAMIQSAAPTDRGQVRVLGIDKVISPGNRYTARLHGKLCRFDGVHLTIYCSGLLRTSVLSTVSAMADT